ncbi:MAG TPA: MFS transporter [Chloroflexota bacterium]|nr:MFS transporter [Chloroflexota bacterium]
MRDWRAVAGLFFLTCSLEALAQGHLNAFTPIYLRQFGLSTEEIAQWAGLLTMFTMLIAFPLAPLWGALAERYARKPVVVRSQLIEAVAYGILAWAPDLHWVIFARLLLGLTFGNVAVIIATQTLLTPNRYMANAISTVQAAINIASSAGPPLGAFLLPHVGARGLFAFDALVCLAAGLLNTAFMPEPDTPRSDAPVLAMAGRTIATVWQRPLLRWNFIGWFLTRGALQILSVYIPVQIVHISADPAPAIGLVMGVYGAIMAVGTWAAGFLVGRTGPTRLFLLSMAGAAIGSFGVALAPELTPLAVCAWLTAIPGALSHTCLYTHLAHHLKPTDRTPVMSLTPFPRNMAMFVIPGIAAGVAALGPAAALALAATAYALATGVGWRMAAATEVEESVIVAEG